jgi:hypothetical protein
MGCAPSARADLWPAVADVAFLVAGVLPAADPDFPADPDSAADPDFPGDPDFPAGGFLLAGGFLAGGFLSGI